MSIRKKNLFNKRAPSQNLSALDDYDEEFSDAEWRYKANRLQARRWRKIKHQLV